jgi:hypothetical protein
MLARLDDFYADLNMLLLRYHERPAWRLCLYFLTV